MGLSSDRPFFFKCVLAGNTTLINLNSMKDPKILILMIAIFFLKPLNLYGKERYNQLELQEDIQRFYTRFTERTLEALLNQGFDDAEKRKKALTEYLLYDSEALKIATGPFPVINLLDMLTFIKLNRIVIRDYWLPKVWKEEGRILLRSFIRSERDIEEVALKIITEKNLRDVNELVRNWRKDNPHLNRVEKIRLADFATYAGKTGKQMQEARKGFSLSSFVLDTRGAVQAADQMVLVANRGVFLAQNMPLLIRLQGRLGIQEILDDLDVRIHQSNSSLDKMSEIGSMVGGVSSLTNNLDILVNDVGELARTFRKEFPQGFNTMGNLKEIHHIINKTNILMTKMKEFRPHDENLIGQIRNEVRRSFLELASVLIFVGLMFSIFWWTGFYIVKKKLRG